MISAKRASTILLEQNEEIRNDKIDKLKEEDCKHLLKAILKTINNRDDFGLE